MAQNYICADNGTRLYPVSTDITTTTVSLDIGHTNDDGYFVRPTHHAVVTMLTYMLNHYYVTITMLSSSVTVLGSSVDLVSQIKIPYMSHTDSLFCYIVHVLKYSQQNQMYCNVPSV